MLDYPCTVVDETRTSLENDVQVCIQSIPVDFEWDRRKAQDNERKHGVDFADAVAVLSDELALTIPDEKASEEQRFITVGTDSLGRILAVAYTWRGDTIRLISARKATRREREHYEGKRR